MFCGKICVIYGKESKVAKTKCQDIYKKKKHLGGFPKSMGPG